MKIIHALLLLSIAVVCRAEPNKADTAKLYLSGTDSANTVEWEFKCSAGGRAGEWSRIPVPSNWEMHGFGTLSYHSTEPSESGHYRHRFSVDGPAIEQKRVYLVFDGVMTDAAVTLNGESVGAKHQGGFYRFKYEVTRLIRPGENLLEVQVDETSANEGVNRAERTGDYWNFGGIFRPVWLEIVPQQHVERFAVDARADGTLKVHAFVDGQGAGSEVRIRVLDDAGRTVNDTKAERTEGETVLQTRVNEVKPWTAETPNLYTLQVELLNGSGEVLHRKSTRIGFRTFEVRLGKGLFLNGKQIVLQGANRHSFNARTGRALNENDHRTDIELMKEMNMNAVRMSHYPPDARFLELCDELGMYVLDEIAGWQKAYDTEVGKQVVRETVTRDVNHPCILFWDNGNEGGWNTELDGEFSKWDPQNRPVLHPWEVFSGVNSAHYKVYPQAQHLARGMTTSWKYDPKETPKMGEYPLIYMPTEFLHGLYDGGAGAGLRDYWDMMRAQPTFGGGFIWVFRDEGVLRADTGELDVMNNKAPDGLVGPMGEKEGSFFTVKELWSPLQVSGELPEQGDVMTLKVENQYSFTDAAQCAFQWSVEAVNAGGKELPIKAAVVAKGGDKFPEIAPGASGTVQVTLPEGWRTKDVLTLRVEDPNGRELWTYGWPLPGVGRIGKDTTEARATSAASGQTAGEGAVREDAETISVVAGDLEVVFGKKDGMLARVTQSGRRISLVNGPRAAAGESRLVSLDTRRDGADVLITANYEGHLESAEWRIQPDGLLRCDYVYRPVEGSTFQGISFDYPEKNVRAKTWLGRGPYRSWQNRIEGSRFGLWSNDYNDTITGWSGWTYPEFKGFFAGVRWLELDTTEARIEVVTHGDDKFVQVLNPGFAPKELQAMTRVETPNAGLAILDVIPAIGSKFSPPEMTGPQGQLVQLPERYRGSVSFKFGPPKPNVKDRRN